MLCTLQVPALNVRSGPSLDYQIVAKIRGTETDPATVLVVGRDASGEWLAVHEQVADGGWVAGNGSYVACEGDIFGLPETQITDGRLVPTPAPIVAAEEPAPAPEAGDGVGDEQQIEPDAVPTEPAVVDIPEGLALITITNVFDHEIRFTLDQKYRVELGPSEVDLQPGDSANILVYPGFVPFSVSSPWRGLSGNDDFFLDVDQSRTLWLIFVPDPDGSGRWILQY